jgi:exodeoxyribonuclease V beta subunit
MSDSTHSISKAQVQNEKIVRPLDVVNMQLNGHHVIEASAGTGKTYNITRIFIRLLLAKQIEVQKILIVTFTKAATEELRGRIAKEVNDLKVALDESPNNIGNDFFAIIKQIQISEEETSLSPDEAYPLQLEKAKALLKVAALELDDASIFTIHGFCQRVIKQSAFLRQQSFAPDIVSSSQAYIVQEVQDWFRRNYNNKAVMTTLALLDVANPDKFFDAFKTALYGFTPLTYVEPSGCLEDAKTALQEQRKRQEDLQAEFLLQASTATAMKVLLDQKDHIQSVLAPTNKPSYSKLESWLIDPNSTKVAISHVNKVLGVKTVNSIASLYADADADEIKEYLQLFHANYAAFLNADSAFTAEIKRLTDSIKTIQDAQAFEVVFSIITEIKAKVAKLKQKHEVIDHDDTINGLAESIRAGNTHLIEYVQHQYPFALIDEFQDTDKDQYAIFSGCYPPSHPSLMLLMIGDPKQAIYGFRGGDINTYLAARDEADMQWTMQHNYRSSPALIDAYNVLFYGENISATSLTTLKANLPELQQDQVNKTTPIDDLVALKGQRLFDEKIPYPWIYSGIEKQSVFKDKYDGAIHFQINTDLYPKPPNGRKEYKDEQVSALANEIVRLNQQASIEGKAVEFKDIAVLVSSAGEANRVKVALSNVGVSCVYLSEKTDIFASNEALSLFFALDGILHGNQNNKFFRAISTDLFGLSPTQLMSMQTNIALFDQFKELIHELKQIWAKDGILVMINTLVKGYFSSRNTHTSKERTLTNYMHLAELLNTQSDTSEHAYQLLNWLKKQLPSTSAAPDDDSDVENAQRLESDEALVKVVTLHGSKGLEYPIVFIPFAGFKPYRPPSNNWVRYYCPSSNKTQIQIGTSDEASALNNDQAAKEYIRLLYVGITRAVHRCYLGIGKQTDFEKSALFTLLEQQGVGDPSTGVSVLSQAAPELFRSASFTSDEIPLVYKQDADKDSSGLITSMFTGSSDQAWQIESFSKISRQQKQVDLTEKDRDEDALSNQKTDYSALPANDVEKSPETPKSVAKDTATAGVDATLDYRFRIERSADTGNLLHNILEDHDFHTPLALSSDNTHISFFNSGDRKCEETALNDWLSEILTTPIPTLNQQSEFTLSSLAPTNTLKEPEFYFPLQDVSAQSLHLLLRTHRVAVSNGQKVSVPSFKISSLTGMMHGFIDLLFKHDGKYYVADYKSNYLGSTAQDYQAPQMLSAIESHTYDLQYLIYCWALDKYLQARLSNYERSTHFGGVYYLFLRGMSPKFAVGSGVYNTKISDEVWTLLDNMFTHDHAKKLAGGAA